jgi:predicted protein tyrosine phosphatase
MIHVCSLARLHETVQDTGASHVVTLIKDISLVTRPHSIAAENHLLIDMDDIIEELEGYVAPCETHVADLIRFIETWPRQAPLVVHCYAGISRSTAGAFVAACMLNPKRDERRIAEAIRAASPTAQPNRLIVSYADRILGREGRMVAAVDAIGKGAPTYPADPFRLDLE